MSDGMVDQLRRLLDVDPDQVTFWSGAGISFDPPASLPLGIPLTHQALAAAFQDDTLDELLEAYAALDLDRHLPRLEAVLEAVTAEYDATGLATLLDHVAHAIPNDTHRFLADHRAAGGRHVTANFDTCIERALAAPPSGSPAFPVIHIHGALDPSGVANRLSDASQLGARLSTIERGFDTTLRDQLDDALTSTSLLVMIGYGGLDYFDVDPYWRGAASRGVLTGRRVLWVNHDGSWDRLTRDRDCDRAQLRWFADQGGAEVAEIRAPTREVLNLPATRWGLLAIADPPAPLAHTDPSLGATPRSRRRATIRLLLAAGLHTKVAERLGPGPLEPDEHLWAAECAWTAGRYRDAANHWTNAYAGTDPDQRMATAERQAACRWIRGQLHAARCQLVATLADSELAAADPSTRLWVYDTLSRVLVHMRRLPDTRWAVSDHDIDEVLRGLEETEQAIGTLGVHMRARVDAVRDHLGHPRTAGDPDRSAVAAFDQYEALLAMLNYEHAQLRARAEHRVGPPPTPAEYLRHQQRFRSIGALGDAARVPLLPGAAAAFTWRETVRELRACDFTRYHRLRLSLLFGLRRTQALCATVARRLRPSRA